MGTLALFRTNLRRSAHVFHAAPTSFRIYRPWRIVELFWTSSTSKSLPTSPFGLPWNSRTYISLPFPFATQAISKFRSGVARLDHGDRHSLSFTYSSDSFPSGFSCRNFNMGPSLPPGVTQVIDFGCFCSRGQ